MHNRKFNIKKDFSELNNLENEIIPLIDRMELKYSKKLKENEIARIILKDYVRKLFNNQFKK